MQHLFCEKFNIFIISFYEHLFGDENMTVFQDKIRIVPDFPKKGIEFYDITTLIKDKQAFAEVIDLLYEKFKNYNLDYVVAIESRGYLFGAPLAYKLGCGLVIIRKPNKLPAKTERIEYGLEYGKDILEIHTDSIEAGKKVLIIDDLLATGGTIKAACSLVEKLQGHIKALAFVVELKKLNGRKHLPQNLPIVSLLQAD